MSDLKARFSEVFEQNHWADGESLSGPGSRRDSDDVRLTIAALHRAVADHGVRSVNDIPCGDFNWMPHFLEQAPQVRYHGFDIVDVLVERHRRIYPSLAFSVIDITCEVPPQADLVLCKDLLNHLVEADIRRALANMKASSATFLLATNNFGFENRELRDPIGGASRHYDLLAPPYGFPMPLWHDQYLGLWPFAALP
ncbi:MAG: class I SAM-dependent methyltransferase [Deltaproteobacteria bacterium]|nr:class I SAM-dependent methyltransferase [Deltaproteobacteria bacterium]